MICMGDESRESANQVPWWRETFLPTLRKRLSRESESSEQYSFQFGISLLFQSIENLKVRGTNTGHPVQWQPTFTDRLKCGSGELCGSLLTPPVFKVNFHLFHFTIENIEAYIIKSHANPRLHRKTFLKPELNSCKLISLKSNIKNWGLTDNAD